MTETGPGPARPPRRGWERSPERTAQPNGARSRVVTTTAGDLELWIGKQGTESFLPEPVGAIGGLAPQTQADVFRQAVAEQWTVTRSNPLWTPRLRGPGQPPRLNHHRAFGHPSTPAAASAAAAFPYARVAISSTDRSRYFG